MPHLDHTAFVNACRDELGVGHHTLRAYAQDYLHQSQWVALARCSC